MRNHPSIGIAVAAAALALARPSLAADPPVITIVEGAGRIEAAGQPFRAAAGVRLRGCDIVRTVRQSLVQVEFDDGSTVAVGGDGSAFVVEVPAGSDVHLLPSGWAKLTVPQRTETARHRLSTPHFDVVVDHGVAVVRAGDKGGELFVESGSATVLARGQRVVVAAGRFYAAPAGGGAPSLEPRASEPFLAAMPRPFRVTLPALRKNYAGRETTRTAATAQEDMPPLPALAELRACQSDATIRNAQEALQRAGYVIGPVDGILGPRTAAALRDFQSRRGLPQTGALDAATLSALESAGR